jgi:HicB family
MKMSLVVEGFRADVIAVGELGDDAVADLAERIASVFTRSVPTRILGLLSDVAAELSSELPAGRIEIRLVGDDVEFAYVDEEAVRPDVDAELSARITLRLSEQLKSRVEESAVRESTSVNGWIVRTLERGLATSKVRNGRPGSRLRGYGTS